MVDLAEGEVLELQARGRFDLHESEHFEILRMKTATFIAACCEVGALVACAPDFVREALGRYGYHIGMAFQIVDDLLDYRGCASETGKPSATDFREGCATLPLLALRDLITAEERDQVRVLFGADVSDEQVEALRERMRTHGAFDRAEQAALKHRDQAIAALESVGKTPERALLEAVAHFVVQRRA